MGRRCCVAWMLSGVLLCGGVSLGAGADPRADRLEEYLGSLELDALLAEYLEMQLGSAGNAQERGSIGERLARVYARLLERERSEVVVRRWEAAAERLLKDVPDLDSLELRLALAQASYQRAESEAERVRLALDRGIDRIALAARFGELLERFAVLARRAESLVEGLERRQEDRMLPAQRELVEEALSQARRHSSQANYLAGFSGRYLAGLELGSDGAARGIRHFGRILDAAQGQEPEISRIADSSVRYPHIARSMIGVGVCLGLRGETDRGLAWLDALEGHENRPAEIEGPLFSARVEILARANRWEDLLSAVSRRRQALASSGGRDVGVLPTLEARLVAVRTLEAVERGSTRPALAMARDVALSDLLARGEFGHAVDLASVFGAERFGVDSFVSQQVRALLIYERARAEHERVSGDSSKPVQDADVARAYLDAAELFERALATEDAFAFPDAMSSAAALVGLCRYYAGDTSGSGGAAWFLRAAENASDPARAAEALWMAILSMDAAIEAQGESVDPEKRGERDALIGRFLAEYPEHPRADVLLLRQIADGQIAPGRAVDLLLNIPESSSMYESARREAARLEFVQFRGASSDRRDWHATRYLDLAAVLLAADERRAREGDSEAAMRAADLGRRMMEAALRMEPPDVTRAERVLEVVQALLEDGKVSSEDLGDEVEYRRAQILLAQGDREGAQQAMERLSTGDSRFVDAGERLLYRDALARWTRARRADAGSEAAQSAARDVVRYGGRLFVAYTEEDASLADPAVRSLARTVGDAALDVHLETGERSWGERAYALFGTLRGTGEADADLLRSLAVVAESLGETESALESWRTLVAGLTVGSEAWFAARTEHLRLLSETDPARAREVMAQHRALYPDLGPQPYRARLEAIEARLAKGGGA